MRNQLEIAKSLGIDCDNLGDWVGWADLCKKAERNLRKGIVKELGFANKGQTAVALMMAVKRHYERNRPKFSTPNLLSRLSALKNLAVHRKGKPSPDDFLESTKGVVGFFLLMLKIITVKTVERVTSISKRYGDHTSRTRQILVNPLKWDIREIGGVLTAVQKTNSPVKRAYWLKKCRGYYYEEIQGFVINGYHSEARTVKEAIKEYKKAKKAQDRADFLAAARASGRLFWVTVADSLKAGNCKIGTETFLKSLEALGLSRVGAIRSDYLQEIAEKDTTRAHYIIRAIGASTRLVAC